MTRSGAVEIIRAARAAPAARAIAPFSAAA